MAKLTYKPINSFQEFNFLGKQLFDFVNSKLNATTGTYVGNAIANRQITIDLIPRLIIVFSESDFEPAVIWMDRFVIGFSKTFDGNNILDGILGITPAKDAFIIGVNIGVNELGINYFYIVLGS